MGEPLSNGKIWLQAWGPIVVFLITQAVVAVVWGTRLQDAVDILTRNDAVQAAKLDQIDQHGTRQLGIITDRQNNVISHIGEIEARLRALEQAHK